MRSTWREEFCAAAQSMSGIANNNCSGSGSLYSCYHISPTHWPGVQQCGQHVAGQHNQLIHIDHDHCRGCFGGRAGAWQRYGCILRGSAVDWECSIDSFFYFGCPTQIRNLHTQTRTIDTHILTPALTSNTHTYAAYNIK